MRQNHRVLERCEINSYLIRKPQLIEAVGCQLRGSAGRISFMKKQRFICERAREESDRGGLSRASETNTGFNTADLRARKSIPGPPRPRSKSFIFTTDYYLDFAKKLAKQSESKLGRVEIKKFSNGEIYLRVAEKVAGQKVFAVGATTAPADNLVEFLLLLNALKTAGGRQIIAIIPFFGYGRADHLVKSGEALSAKLMVDLLECAGVDKIITVDLHSPRVVKFISTPLIHLSAKDVLVKAIAAKKLTNLVSVAPDHGALVLAKYVAKRLKCSTAWMEKVRPRHNVASLGALHGDVKGKIAILVDDMIDTAGTIIEAAKRLKEAGVKKIIIAATHAVFSGPAINRLNEAPIERVFVTDTIPLPPKKKIKKLCIISVTDSIVEVLK